MENRNLTKSEAQQLMDLISFFLSKDESFWKENPADFFATQKDLLDLLLK